MDGTLGTLEFDLSQKWAKGLRIHFCNAKESRDFEKSGNLETSFLLKQVHSDKAVRWESNKNPSAYKNIEADAFIAGGNSYKNSLAKLVIRTADCCPLFYIDRENEIVAAIHAGWRGLAKGIHLRPFKEGFDPKSTWIWCGPSLSGKSFEVGEDMWSQFSSAIQSNETLFEKKSTAEGPNFNKRYFHCWEFLKQDFQNVGVELFYNVDVNTFEDSTFNSYRRWNNGEKLIPLTHNYSWIGFVK